MVHAYGLVVLNTTNCTNVVVALHQSLAIKQDVLGRKKLRYKMCLEKVCERELAVTYRLFNGQKRSEGKAVAQP